jgi:hypothetical protein
MGMESKQQRLLKDQVTTRVTYASDADVTMTSYSNVVRATLTSSNSKTVTLPAVAECRGETYTIILEAVGTGVLSIVDKANDGGLGTRALGIAGSCLVVRSDGEMWHVLSEGGGRQSPNASMVRFFDDFVDYQPAHTELDRAWILNAGADAQAVDPVQTAAEGGTMTLVTGNADGTTANDASQLVLAFPVQADSGGLYFETRLKIATAITAVSVYAGFTDATGLEEPVTNSADTLTTTASDAAGFLYDTDATTDQWWMAAVDGDTDDTGNAALGVAPVADTYQVLRAEVSADGATIKFFINGVLVGTLSGAAGVSPDVNLYFTIIACATTTTSKTVTVDYVEVGHARR